MTEPSIKRETETEKSITFIQDQAIQVGFTLGEPSNLPSPLYLMDSVTQLPHPPLQFIFSYLTEGGILTVNIKETSLITFNGREMIVHTHEDTGNETEPKRRKQLKIKLANLKSIGLVDNEKNMEFLQKLPTRKPVLEQLIQEFPIDTAKKMIILTKMLEHAGFTEFLLPNSNIPGKFILLNKDGNLAHPKEFIVSRARKGQSSRQYIHMGNIVQISSERLNIKTGYGKKGAGMLLKTLIDMEIR